MNPILYGAACTGLSLWMLTALGNRACRLMFGLAGLRDALADADAAAPRVGRYIGAIERLIIAAGLVVHSWEAIAAVIALKSIARFKELDNVLPAEYFLLGSLFSILWSIAVATGWLIVDHQLGLGIAATIQTATR